MNAQKDFEDVARTGGGGSFLGELWALIQQKRKYWMAPLIVVLLMFAVLVILSGTAAAPFIYTLF